MIPTPRKLIQMGWNKRPLTIEDFDQYCYEEGIWVYKVPLKHDEGMFFRFRERPVIVLNKRLAPGMLVWAAFHELGHYCLHPPELQYFAAGTTDKANYEANFLAAIALIPKRYVEMYTKADIQEEYGYPNELFALRKELYERYKV